MITTFVQTHPPDVITESVADALKPIEQEGKTSRDYFYGLTME